MILKNLLTIAATAAVMTISQACDNISEDDRFITEPKPIPDPHNVPKVLLIQEFTGVRCPNCPSGAQMIHNIQAANPGKVIAVGLHAQGGGAQTRPWSASQDFRTDEAQVLYSYYKPAGLPAAVFNGEISGETYQFWTTIADDYLFQEAKMTIELTSDFSSSDHTATVDYNITFTGDITDNLNLMIWLTEDDIIGRQSSGSETLKDYVHNHVLRKSFFSEEWGKSLGKSFNNGQKISGYASTTLEDSWTAENCHIVVFVQGADNKIVEQAAEIAVIPESGND